MTTAAAFAAAAMALVPRSAHAGGVHWDLGAEVGPIERFRTGLGPAAKTPGPGGQAEGFAHVALLPMVRVGAYVSHDFTPSPGAADRQTTEAGLHLKLTPPLLRAPWTAWVFAGAGYARVYAQSTTRLNPGAAPTSLGGAGGGLFEVPLGVGLGVRARPWVIFAELGVRFGVATTGTLYDAARCPCAGPTYPGEDSFAVGLSLGVSLEQ
jgi:hypothetical protein